MVTKDNSGFIVQPAVATSERHIQRGVMRDRIKLPPGWDDAIEMEELLTDEV